MNTGISQPDAHVSTAIAAEMLGVKREFVTKLAREGAIDAYQKGRFWYVSLHSLRTYLSQHRPAAMLQKAHKINQTTSHEEKEAARETLRETVDVEIANAVAHEHPIKNALHEAIAKKNSLTLHVQAAPLYAIHPAVDVLHRATALLTALALTVGMYTFLRPDYAKVVLSDAKQAIHVFQKTSAIMLNYNALTLIASELPAQKPSINPFVPAAPNHVAAAGSLGEPLGEIARRFHREINLFFVHIFGK